MGWGCLSTCTQQNSKSVLSKVPIWCYQGLYLGHHHTPHAYLVWVNVSAWHNVSRECPFWSHWWSSLMPRPCPLTNKRGLVATELFLCCAESAIILLILNRHWLRPCMTQSYFTGLHAHSDDVTLFHWLVQIQNCWVQPRNHSIVSHQTPFLYERVGSGHETTGEVDVNSVRHCNTQELSIFQWGEGCIVLCCLGKYPTTNNFDVRSFISSLTTALTKSVTYHTPVHQFLCYKMQCCNASQYFT